MDQNQIESKYLWYWDHKAEKKALRKFNLTTLLVEFMQEFGSHIYATSIINLPNNRFLGLKTEQLSQSLFISDEMLNIKIIEAKTYRRWWSIPLIGSCFYDDSISIFKGICTQNECDSYDCSDLSHKRYFIQQNKWETLADPPTFPHACIWLGQKIIFIAEQCAGIWIYDLLIDSYTHHLPIKSEHEFSDQILTKYTGKIYLLIISYLGGIYSCDDPLSDWNFIYSFRNKLSLFESIFGYNFLGSYEGSNYFLNGSKIYQFDFEKLEIKRCLDVENLNLGEKALEINILSSDIE